MKIQTFAVAILSAVLGITAIPVPVAFAQSHPSHLEGESGEASTDPTRLYCNEHEAYEDECFICHPELREQGRLWCNEHGRYEDRCFICHPELRDPNRQFCETHGLFEDECHLCRPPQKGRSTPGAEGGSDPETDADRLMCEEHGVFEDECGICHPELAATIMPGRGLKVRFASVDAAAKAGVKAARPEVEAMAWGVDGYAEIAFDQNRLAHVAVPVGGILRNIHVDLGANVEANELLATVSSATIAEAVSKMILAKQTLERERRLFSQRISAEREVQQAQALYQANYQQLRTLGFSEDQIGDLHKKPGDPAVLELRAPFAGEIVERNAVQGSLVGEGDTLFVLADRSVMWGILSIPEAKLAEVRLGQMVEFSVEPEAEQRFVGELTWLSAELDDRTRMARARVEIPNPQGLLRANMFARARVLTHDSEEAVLVPSSAVQQIEGRPFVFVQLEPDLFEARPVRVDGKANGQVAVVGDLDPDSEIVVSHSYVVKSQLQLSRLGAGCVD